MVPFNLKVLAKFDLCLNYSQTIDECSLICSYVLAKAFCNCLQARALIKGISGEVCTHYVCF